MTFSLRAFLFALLILSSLAVEAQNVTVDLHSSTPFLETHGTALTSTHSGKLKAGYGLLNNQYQALYWTGDSTTPQALTSTDYKNTFALGCSNGGLPIVGQGTSTVTGKTVALAWTSPTTVIDLNPTINNVAMSLSVANGAAGGQIVGYAQNQTGGTLALLWTTLSNTALSLHPTGYSSSQAMATDGTSQAGYAQPNTASYNHAVWWSSTAASAVDLHPGGDYYESYAQGIDGAAQVGYATRHDNTSGQTIYEAFLWKGTAASRVNLNPPGYLYSFALGVRGNSQVGYGANAAGKQVPLLWHGDASSALDLSLYLPPGYTNGKARAIDAAGNILGEARPPGSSFPHAILWKANYAPVFTNVRQNATTVAGLPYAFLFESNAQPSATSYSISLGALPSGFTFNGPFLEGTPTQTGTYACDVLASNGVGQGTIQGFTLTVVPKPEMNMTTVGNGLLALSGNTGNLAQGSDGSFYSTVSNSPSYSGKGALIQFTPQGQQVVLHAFGDGSVAHDGLNPTSVIVGSDGNLYGTTQFGGAFNQGTIFKYAQGQLTILHSFENDSTLLEGSEPLAPLIEARDGLLYGTTSSGGALLHGGTLFKITRDGVLTILHTFRDGSVIGDGISFDTDGAAPKSALLQTADGSFYGTTTEGGIGSSDRAGYGTVFRLSPTGKYTLLYAFRARNSSVDNDADQPMTSLVQGSGGLFYGMTRLGGTQVRGTIYQITSQGIETILRSFGDGAVGNDAPHLQMDTAQKLVKGPDGNFYGTTTYGGSAGLGMLFQMAPDGTMLVLHSFGDGSISHEGVQPTGDLLLGADGSFYGLTSAGGTNGAGTLFRFTYGKPPVVKAPQTLSFPVIADQPYGVKYTLAATASSGLPVRYTVVSGPAILSGKQLTFTDVGLVTIKASQSGSSAYLAAADVTETLQVIRGPQVITFPAIPKQTWGSAPITLPLEATASSGLLVTYTVSGTATLSGNTLTVTHPGTVNVTARQSGNVTFLAAPAVTRQFNVAKIAQTITFPTPGRVAVGQTLTLTALSNSGLPVAYQIVSGTATLSGNTVTFTTAGTVKLTATQAGDDHYAAARAVSVNVSVR